MPRRLYYKLERERIKLYTHYSVTQLIRDPFDWINGVNPELLIINFF